MDKQCSSNISAVEANDTAAHKEESVHISTSSSWTILQTDSGSVVEPLALNDMVMEGMKNNKKEEADWKQKQSSNDEHTNERLADDSDTPADDVSDGISIISDCDTTGRITPHPFMREHPSELNFEFESGHELPTIHNLYENGQQNRWRRSTFFEQGDRTQAQETLAMMRPDKLSYPKIVGYQLPSLVLNGLTAMFYVGATLAVLAFFGLFRNPEFNAVVENKHLADFEQRLVDLELQNNLMRAEIDLMSKQLLYVKNMQLQGQNTKTFRAWPGNSKTPDALDITKKDLKRTYKCLNGEYVEIATMCDNDSKERYSTNHEKSKKRFGKQPTIKRHSQDDDSSSGEWHERMMRHREHSRQRREQKQNKNWYIEWGGSREQKRSTEKRR